MGGGGEHIYIYIYVFQVSGPPPWSWSPPPPVVWCGVVWFWIELVNVNQSIGSDCSWRGRSSSGK